MYVYKSTRTEQVPRYQPVTLTLRGATAYSCQSPSQVQRVTKELSNTGADRKMNSMIRSTRMLRPAVTGVASQQRRSYQKASPFYNLVLKSNVTYVTFVLVGAAVAGGLYGATMDFVWKSYNRGRLYDQIDWTKWNSKWKQEE